MDKNVTVNKDVSTYHSTQEIRVEAAERILHCIVFVDVKISSEAAQWTTNTDSVRIGPE